MLTPNTVVESWLAIREKKPLVLCLTNYVVMNINANALLAIGATPLMAHSPKELPELIEKIDSLVINIGTLDDIWLDAMKIAIDCANQHHKPIVLDPVGCGFTQYRTQAAQQLAHQAQRLWIRGNVDEIQALLGQPSRAKGLDAQTDQTHNLREICHQVAQTFEANVVISGKTDWIYENHTHIQNQTGEAWMQSVTGMGCTLSALIGAFLPTSDHAGLAATACWTIAGELAKQHAQGIGDFNVRILDTLHQLTPEHLYTNQNWGIQ